jgi:hypothetical protein
MLMIHCDGLQEKTLPARQLTFVHLVSLLKDQIIPPFPTTFQGMERVHFLFWNGNSRRFLCQASCWSQRTRGWVSAIPALRELPVGGRQDRPRTRDATTEDAGLRLGWGLEAGSCAHGTFSRGPGTELHKSTRHSLRSWG